VPIGAVHQVAELVLAAHFQVEGNPPDSVIAILDQEVKLFIPIVELAHQGYLLSPYG